MHDLGGADLAQALAPGRAAHRGHDLGPGAGGELHGEPADPAGAPVTMTRRPSNRPSGRRARRAVTAATGRVAAAPRSTPSGTAASSADAHRPVGCPRPAPSEGDHAGADRGPRAVGRRRDHRPGGVPTRHLAGRAHLTDVARLAGVQRDRLHRDEHLVGGGLRVGGFGECEPPPGGRFVHDRAHGAPSMLGNEP